LIHMEQNTIGVRELQRNFKKITNKALRGQAFVVVRNAKPVFNIIPALPRQKKYTLKDFKRLRFRGGEPDLSSRIDEVVYLGKSV